MMFVSDGLFFAGSESVFTLDELLMPATSIRSKLLVTFTTFSTSFSTRAEYMSLLAETCDALGHDQPNARQHPGSNQ